MKNLSKVFMITTLVFSTIAKAQFHEGSKSVIVKDKHNEYEKTEFKIKGVGFVYSEDEEGKTVAASETMHNTNFVQLVQYGNELIGLDSKGDVKVRRMQRGKPIWITISNKLSVKDSRDGYYGPKVKTDDKDREVGEDGKPLHKVKKIYADKDKLYLLTEEGRLFMHNDTDQVGNPYLRLRNVRVAFTGEHQYGYVLSSPFYYDEYPLKVKDMYDADGKGALVFETGTNLNGKRVVDEKGNIVDSGREMEKEVEVEQDQQRVPAKSGSSGAIKK